MGERSRELPKAIQDQINQMPEYSYGVNRVTLTLRDGTIIPDAYVGWAMDVLRIGKSTELHFDPSDVVAAEHQGPGGG